MRYKYGDCIIHFSFRLCRGSNGVGFCIIKFQARTDKRGNGMDYNIRDGESILEYEYRICSQKEQIGTWEDVAKIINDTLNQKYTESKYRKQYQEMERARNTISDDDIKEQIRELEKAKVKMRDERNEVSRLYREQARRESLQELFERCLTSYTPTGFSSFRLENKDYPESSLIIPISDLHYGINIDNSMNKYNEEIAGQRLSAYLNKIINIASIHNSRYAHIILLGDEVSGIIHTNLRLENNENVVKQVMGASELVSQFISAIASKFQEVYVYSVSGNHSRVFQDAKLNAKGENLDTLIPFYAKARLSKFDNVMFVDNVIDESIVSFVCRKQIVYAVHGDKDNISSVVHNLTLMSGCKPNIIYMGHLHTNSLRSIYDTKVIQSGCICGNDAYCMDKRLRGRPEQAVSVITDSGLDCIYDIKLN